MDEEDIAFGPSLPPHLLKSSAPSDNKIIGPCMPGNFKPVATEEKRSDDDQSDGKDEDDMHIGPLPPGVEPKSRAQLKLEERALEIKLNGMEDQTGSSASDVKSREEWMIELPEVKKVSDLGLGARQFRKREGPDFSDRSSWTDTPQSKLDKEKRKSKVVEVSSSATLEEKMLKERDKAMEKMKKKYDKEHKREKSLLELHQDKLKKKKKKDKNDKDERRPFSREVDLAVNKFDETRKQAAIKKSKLLDNRFSAGSSKFL